jgi:predicted transcriptional regulator
MSRMTVEFTGLFDQRLEQIADDLGITKVEVLRRALASYSYLHREARVEGGEIVVEVETKGRPHKLVIP